MAAAGRERHRLHDRQPGVEEVDEPAAQDVRRPVERLVQAGRDDVGAAAQGQVVRLAVGQADGLAGAADQAADVIGAIGGDGSARRGWLES